LPFNCGPGNFCGMIWILRGQLGTAQHGYPIAPCLASSNPQIPPSPGPKTICKTRSWSAHGLRLRWRARRVSWRGAGSGLNDNYENAVCDAARVQFVLRICGARASATSRPTYQPRREAPGLLAWAIIVPSSVEIHRASINGFAGEPTLASLCENARSHTAWVISGRLASWPAATGVPHNRP